MLKTSLQLRLGQQLKMTPQLQQAIRLLQMPALELQAHLRELLETNVMLEAEEDTESTGTFESLGAGPNEIDLPSAGEDASPALAEERTAPEVEIIDDAWQETSAAPGETPWQGDDDERQQEFTDERGESLHEHLIWQLEMSRLDERQMAIGRAVIDAINDDGYLIEPFDAIAATLRPDIEASEQEIAAMLEVVQGFDPLGVGARNVAECVSLQLAALQPDTPGRDTALAIAAAHLDLVATREMGLLKRQLKVSDEELEQALALVRSCHPRPGSQISAAAPEYVVPDVFVRRRADGWTVEINSATLPRVRINEGYASLIGRASSHATMRAQLQEARWLLKSLEIRHETLLKVARSIVERQHEFLEHGEEYMRPMILRDIAEAIGMHESTVSRVTSGKYMHTPRGVFELRYFFSSQVEGADGSGTSSTAIRAKIRKLIRDEPPNAPLSDSRIAEILSKEGIPVARRTVAKYRESMGIAPSNERRRA
ncbi:MAG: RNA polymerase factor sigma-54 [Pseudomonadota bacterium]|jgi:RNA polymerase sigma-54 factor|nr:MAG: RNA polymerase factor sigma-54 [Pseudomonadota bacterium]